LFGNYVDELNAFLGAGDCNNAVVIMQFAKAKNFQGFQSFKYNLLSYSYTYFLFYVTTYI
jgi:hypothetical protein